VIQEGNIGLMTAVNKFEYAATTSFLRTPSAFSG
jgi:DNA-directed RNA polymerase sigma subunit (sigma70/sigma32)